MREEWKQIPGFANYDVSNLGEVANNKTNVILTPTKTLQGALKVNLQHRNTKELHTRSVKRLVAEAFVHNENPRDYDTVLQFDGNQENCEARNLMWRPRWFVLNWTREVRKGFPDFYHTGVIVEMNHEGRILDTYPDMLTVCHQRGVLPSEIWEKMHTRRPVFPTQTIFVPASQV